MDNSGNDSSQRHQASPPTADSLDVAFAAAASALASQAAVPQAPIQGSLTGKIPASAGMSNSVSSRVNPDPQPSSMVPASLLGSFQAVHKPPVKNATTKSKIRSCESCRTSKIKCDGVKPVCGGCTRKFKICIYAGTNAVEGSSNGGVSTSNEPSTKPNTQIQELEKRIQKMEELLIQKDNQAHQREQQNVSSPQIDNQSHDYGIEVRNDIHHSSSNSDQSIPDTIIHSSRTHISHILHVNNTLSSGGSSATLKSRVNSSSLDTGVSIASSSASSTTLNTTTITKKTISSTDIIVAGTDWARAERSFTEAGLTMPTTECLKSIRSIPSDSLDQVVLSMSQNEYELVNSFLRNQNVISFFDFVHPRTTIMYWSQLPSILRLSICASGAHLSDPPMCMNIVTTYYEKARSLIPVIIEEPSIPALQALLILSTLTAYLSNLSLSWQMMGMAVRMAQLLNLDQDPDFSLNSSVNQLSWVEKETRRRLWWSCYSREKIVSVHWKRPPILKSNTGRMKSLLPNSIWLSVDALSPEQVHFETISQTIPQRDDLWGSFASLIDFYYESIHFAEREVLNVDTPASYFRDGSKFINDMHTLSASLASWKTAHLNFHDDYPNPSIYPYIISQYKVGTASPRWSLPIVHMFYHCIILFIYRPILSYAEKFDQALMDTPLTDPLEKRIDSFSKMTMLDYHILRAHVEKAIEATTLSAHAILAFNQLLINNNRPIAHAPAGLAIVVFEGCLALSLLGRGWDVSSIRDTSEEMEQGRLIPKCDVNQLHVISGWLEAALETQTNLLVALKCTDYLLSATRQLVERLNVLIAECV